VLTSLLLEWGTPGWLLLGGATVVASYAMGPAVRRAAGAGRETDEEAGDAGEVNRQPALAS
jgi:hypothetical protein